MEQHRIGKPIKKFLKKSLVLLLVTPIAFANKPLVFSDLVGKYHCRGYDFASKERYDENGVMKITGNTISFTRFDKKDSTFSATGLILNETVSFIFWNDSQKLAGVASYQRLPNGDLKGIWTLKNSKEVGEDYCERLDKRAT